MRFSLQGRRFGRRSLLATAVVLVVVAGAGAWLLTRGSSSAAAEPTTVTASSGTIQQTVSASGTIEPAEQDDLDFAVSGTVTRVLVDEGDTVRRGQVLATIDPTMLQASVTAAASTLEAARTQLAEDTAAGASDTQLAADAAAKLSAESALDAAREDRDAAKLRSTITGTVAALDLAVGDQVTGSESSSSTPGTTTADTGASTSTAQVTVVSRNTFVVDATVAATDVTALKKGMQTEITPTGASDTVFGTVASVGLVAQTSSSGAAEFPVTIEVTGRQKKLYAGTAAEVSIVVKQVEDVLTVPTMALHTEDGETYVEQVVDGATVRATVEVGTAYGVQTEITQGLAEGDEVELPVTLPAGAGGRDTGGLTERGFPGGGMSGEGPGMPSGPVQ